MVPALQVGKSLAKGTTVYKFFGQQVSLTDGVGALQLEESWLPKEQQERLVLPVDGIYMLMKLYLSRAAIAS